MSQTIFAPTPFKSTRVDAGWWLNKLYINDAALGKRDGGYAYDAKQCPVGIKRVDYAYGSKTNNPLGSIQFTCDDNTATAVQGSARGIGTVTHKSFICPSGSYLNKITTPNAADNINGKLTFGCTTPEPVVYKPDPVIPDPIVYEPDPVVYEPDPVVYEPEPVEPVVYEPTYTTKPLYDSDTTFDSEEIEGDLFQTQLADLVEDIVPNSDPVPTLKEPSMKTSTIIMIIGGSLLLLGLAGVAIWIIFF
jgi:hypothetical protein